jgi:hypothetical protein
MLLANPDLINHDMRRDSVKPDIILRKQHGYLFH